MNEVLASDNYKNKLLIVERMIKLKVRYVIESAFQLKLDLVILDIRMLGIDGNVVL